MKLVTFQSMDALKDMMTKGYLATDERLVDLKKMGIFYDWIVDKMKERIPAEEHIHYPLWCWVKCGNGICPPKRKGEPVKGFDVKITFHKPEQDVFVTDFRRYSFVLNNRYIPVNREDKEAFERELAKYKITEKDLKAYVRPDKFETHRTDEEFSRICEKVRKSFDRCITEDSDILQGCVWKIGLDEVEKIELLTNSEYQYGTLNYVRSDGRQRNWIKEYERTLI